MWFSKKKHTPTAKEDFDFLPLFFWDKGLSDMAKIIMCIACGGEINREKTLEKLKNSVPEEVVSEISRAVEELEFYGYISNSPYKGNYHEPRVDRKICPCPNNRLPKIIPPVPGAMPSLHRKGTEMYVDAARLGFIAETGRDTTYLLYSALRMFTGAENVLAPNELVVLPHVGTESIREGTATEELTAYPHAVTAVIITTNRVLFIQEDGNVVRRRNGLARIISRPFSAIEKVSVDNTTGRITFKFWVDSDCGSNLTTVTLDLLTVFALDNYQRYYNAARTAITQPNTLPPLTYEIEKRIN